MKQKGSSHGSGGLDYSIVVYMQMTLEPNNAMASDSEDLEFNPFYQALQVRCSQYNLKSRIKTI